jgi:uncharacterized protein DUF559
MPPRPVPIVRQDGELLDHVGREAALTALSQRQHGPFALWQLQPLGVDGKLASKRVQRGRWFRIHRAVYSPIPEALLTPAGRRMAAVLACGPDAFLCVRSAAAHQRLRANSALRIDVGVPRRSARRHRGVHVHRLADIRPDEIEIVDGIPCTTIARTLLDLGAVLTQRQTERVLNEAELLEVFDLTAIAEQLARHPRHPGAKTLARALARIADGPTLTFSWFEEQMMELVDAACLPRPVVNRFIDPGDGDAPVRADFHWPAHGLVVETDGWQFHRSRQAFESNRRNDQRLALLGLRVLRFTARHFTEERPRVTHTIRSLLS